MPVMKKEIELDDGTKLWVKQASGLQKLPFEAKMARIFRQFRHFGTDQTKWNEDQQEEFLSAMEDAECGMMDQMAILVPQCIDDESFDVNSLTPDELRNIYLFIAGVSESDGAPPLE